WARTHGGARYSQVFIDVTSRYIWTVRLKKKTESDEAIRTVLRDCRARSGRPVRFLRTDGDGIFGRSKSFQELQAELGFIHERPAPYDHKQSGLIDRECRTLLEAVSTYMWQSGAPPSFWGEAVRHYTFTRNNTPSQEVTQGTENKFLSSENVLQGLHRPFHLQHLVAFGTQCTCFKKRREKRSRLEESLYRRDRRLRRRYASIPGMGPRK